MTSESRLAKSRKSSRSFELPPVFTDRCLGDHQVPEGLRAAGFEVHTMREVYGQAEAQRLGDPRWIEEMTDMGFVLFSKDAAIRNAHPVVVRDVGARVFLLPDQQKPAGAMIARYVNSQKHIARHCQRPGPFLYMVGQKRPEHFKLPKRR